MHTPGPWYSINNAVFKDYRDSAVLVAHASATFGDETDFNAALIAAAPDLLNAVEYLLTIITRNEPRLLGMMEVDYARAALLKATGG
jgi:hypothetical protein